MSARTRIYVIFAVVATSILILVFTVATATSGVELTIGDLLNNPSAYASRYLTLEGMLIEDSVKWDARLIKTEFRIVDEQQNELRVVYDGVKPDGFYEGVSVIASGRFDSTGPVFLAEKIQTRCPSKYEGPAQSSD